MKLPLALLGALLVALSSVARGAKLRSPPQVLSSSGPSRRNSSLSAPAASTQNGTVALAASNLAAHARLPFSARTDAAVGKVWALYYSNYAGHKATSIEATETYAPGTRGETPWHQGAPLPVPSCSLKLRTQTNYPTENREANLRLAEIAVCDYMAGTGGSVPGCGASGTQVCELSLMVPAPSDDGLFEPHNAAAMALVAYSRLCAIPKSAYEQGQCAVHSSEKAILGGLETSGALRALPSTGFIQLKMEAAYELGLTQVVLPSSSETDYHATTHHQNSTDVLKWTREPPAATFCGNFACVVQQFMR